MRRDHEMHDPTANLQGGVLGSTGEDVEDEEITMIPRSMHSC